jgi:hypothetical protein
MNGIYPLLGKSVRVTDEAGHVTVADELIGIRLKAGISGQMDRFEWVMVRVGTEKVELRGDLRIEEIEQEPPESGRR